MQLLRKSPLEHSRQEWQLKRAFYTCANLDEWVQWQYPDWTPGQPYPTKPTQRARKVSELSPIWLGSDGLARLRNMKAGATVPARDIGPEPNDGYAMLRDYGGGVIYGQNIRYDGSERFPNAIKYRSLYKGNRAAAMRYFAKVHLAYCKESGHKPRMDADGNLLDRKPVNI